MSIPVESVESQAVGVRFIIRSCCFMNRLSATMVFAPPGTGSLAVEVNKWARSISRPSMAEQVREVGHQEQDSPGCPFQVKITNSPEPGLLTPPACTAQDLTVTATMPCTGLLNFVAQAESIYVKISD
jgi:hypothetical protein